MATEYDVIVVGARCAGAPTAMLLAKRGYRVLVVDRASFPSDTVSTLVIHAPGVAALARWGLLDKVTATDCPPMERYSFDFGPLTITGTPRPVDGISVGYAPRRTVLDTILVDAADRAGAEVRERFTVDDVVVEDGRVVGVRGRDANGTEVVERARVVVGADGRFSRVVRAVRPDVYHTKPKLQFACYTFWSGLPVSGMETVIRPYRGWGAMPTNDGLTLVVVGWPYAEMADFRADVEGNYLKTFELAPEFAERVHAATRVDRFIGTAVAGHFHQPFGPGWALVGDAGYEKDPITAQGISDAFRDAELCVTALDQAFRGARPYHEAMGEYQRRRDAQVLPIYEFTSEMAMLAPPPPEMAQLLGAVAGSASAMDDFASVIAGTLSPAEFFRPDNIVGVMSGAAPTPV